MTQQRTLILFAILIFFSTASFAAATGFPRKPSGKHLEDMRFGSMKAAQGLEEAEKNGGETPGFRYESFPQPSHTKEKIDWQAVRALNQPDAIKYAQDLIKKIDGLYERADFYGDDGRYDDKLIGNRAHLIAVARRMHELLEDGYVPNKVVEGIASREDSDLKQTIERGAPNAVARFYTREVGTGNIRYRGWLQDKMLYHSQRILFDPLEKFKRRYGPTLAALTALSVVMGSAAYIFAKFGGTEWVKNKIRQMFDRPTIFQVKRRKTGWFNRNPDTDVVREADLVLEPGVRRRIAELKILMNRRHIWRQAGKKKRFAFPTVLMHGPPGTGKTSIARMIADNTVGDDGRPMNFISLSGADFAKINKISDKIVILEKMVETAKKLGNTIIFIDEVEGVMPKRTEDSGDDPLLIKFMTLFPKRSTDYMLIMATNHRNKIDPAMLSRVAKDIKVDLPTGPMIKKITEKLIERHLLDYGYTSNLDIDRFVPELLGRSGRDILKVIENSRDTLDANEENKLTNEIFNMNLNPDAEEEAFDPDDLDQLAHANDDSESVGSQD